tara:strand:- start:1206 stop:1412 length:207 start_codon:yes stop_codon:yes gene_type:complete
MKRDKDTVTLCCTFVNPCCPTIEKKSKKFIIKDDFGNQIEINKTDINKIIEDINDITSSNRDSLDPER